MKCRFIRDDLQVNTRRIDPDPDRMTERTAGRWFWNKGAEHEHPDVWKLVFNGCAEPADEECEQRCAGWRDGLADRLHARDRLAKGIHPDDFDKYDRGEIDGYNPDGSYIPGPNARAEDEE